MSYINDLAPGDVLHLARGTSDRLYTILGVAHVDNDGDNVYDVLFVDPVEDTDYTDTRIFREGDYTISRVRDRVVPKHDRFAEDLVPGDSFTWLGNVYTVTGVHSLATEHDSVRYRVSVDVGPGRALYCYKHYPITRKTPQVQTERTFTLGEFADIVRAAADQQGWCESGVNSFLAARGIVLPVKTKTVTVTVPETTTVTEIERLLRPVSATVTG